MSSTQAPGWAVGDPGAGRPRPLVTVAADHEDARADLGDAAEAGQVAPGDDGNGYAVRHQPLDRRDGLGQGSDGRGVITQRGDDAVEVEGHEQRVLMGNLKQSRRE